MLTKEFAVVYPRVLPLTTFGSTTSEYIKTLSVLTADVKIAGEVLIVVVDGRPVSGKQLSMNTVTTSSVVAGELLIVVVDGRPVAGEQLSINTVTTSSAAVVVSRFKISIIM